MFWYGLLSSHDYASFDVQLEFPSHFSPWPMMMNRQGIVFSDALGCHSSVQHHCANNVTFDSIVVCILGVTLSMWSFFGGSLLV